MAKQKPAALGNIVPNAAIKVMELGDEGATWKTVAVVIDTPRAINVALKKHKLTSAWVFGVCGKAMWFAGKEIAHR
jgi:hypothetical protein